MVLSKEAWAAIKDITGGKTLPKTGNFLLQKLRDGPQIFKVASPKIRNASADALSGFVPKLVKTMVEGGQVASWLGEFRKVVIMFIRLSSIDFNDKEVLTKLQDAVVIVQTAVQKHEGTVSKKKESCECRKR